VRTLAEINEQGDLHPLDFAALVAEKLETAEQEDVAEETATDTDATPSPVEAVAESDEAPEQAPESTLPDGTYEDEHGRLRGPDGKFVAKGTEAHPHDPDAQPDPAATPEPEEWVLDVDPDVQSFLEKYDGDLNKALRGAIEAQKMVGRQGSELGELRKVQQDLEDLKTTLLQRQEPAQPQVPMPNYREMIDEDPRTAAITAYDNQHWDAMGAALAAWKEEDPAEARLFAMNVKHEADMLQQRMEFEQRLNERAPAADPDEDFTRRMAGMVQRYPDLEATLPAIGEVSKERPLLRQVLESGSPADRVAALEDLYLIAKSRTVQSDTSAAMRQVQVRVSDEAREARTAAAVVSASGASAATGDQPTKADEFRGAFAAKLAEQGLWGSGEESS
jgi:hypothetical protein